MIDILRLSDRLAPFYALDEVDSKVDGRYILPNLLAPLWDGTYYVGSTTYYLGRAVFFFAASSMLPTPSIETVLNDPPNYKSRLSYDDYAKKWSKKVSASVKKTKVDKLNDFLDRMDAILCIPPISKTFTRSDPAKDYWLLACALIKKHFNDVTKVEKSAAWLIINLLLESGSIRRAESAVFRSHQPENEFFMFQNLPENVRKIKIDKSIANNLTNCFFDISEWPK